MKLFIQFVIILISVTSCTTKSDKITNVEDYNIYLSNPINKALVAAQSEFEFWTNKLQETPNQYPYLAKIAASQSQLFSATGGINYLIDAEKSLLTLNKQTNCNKAGYLRALSRNYISQHRFKEALSLLKKAELNGENLDGTKKMLFDVHLELGNNEQALKYLKEIKNLKDFDYLIRLSKWSDHKGDLASAIKYMEKAKVIADLSNVDGLKRWAYTNIADFYGHNGELDKSYKHYLKALALNPDDAYAKKGIAWIVFSHEKNGDEALRILESITKNYDAPDYYLFKAEIAEYQNDKVAQESNLEKYFESIKNDDYGDMYNAYSAKLLAETNIKLALSLAKKEILNRPTALSYDLLAWSYFQQGEKEKALEIANKYVINKTHEPEVLYHIAEIYKANNKKKEVRALKQELLGSVYELGPTKALKIARL